MRNIVVLVLTSLLCSSVSVWADDDDRRRGAESRHHGLNHEHAFAQSERRQAFAEAKETCSDLQGGTRGLFRLCVRFCKRQDLDSLGRVLDPDRMARRAERSDWLLAAYDARKTADDPDMPCIEQNEICPCWDVEAVSPANFTSRSVPPSCMFPSNDILQSSLVQAGSAANGDWAMLIASRIERDAVTFSCETVAESGDRMTQSVSEVDYNVCSMQIQNLCNDPLMQ